MRRDTRTTTPHDTERWERANGPDVDHDWNEAAESNFTTPFTDCGACNKPHCLMCALNRVFNGWRPTA